MKENKEQKEKERKEKRARLKDEKKKEVMCGGELIEVPFGQTEIESPKGKVQLHFYGLIDGEFL